MGFEFEKIQKLCDRNGITITKLERVLDCGNGTIKKWSTAYPRVDKLQKVADFFEVPISYFFSDEKETPFVNDDEELTEVLEKMRDRPEMRMLFSITKDATADDVMRAVKIIEALKNNEG